MTKTTETTKTTNRTDTTTKKLTETAKRGEKENKPRHVYAKIGECSEMRGAS